MDFPLLSGKLPEHQKPRQSTSAAGARPFYIQLSKYTSDVISSPFDSSAIEFFREKKQSNVYSVPPLITSDKGEGRPTYFARVYLSVYLSVSKITQKTPV